MKEYILDHLCGDIPYLVSITRKKIRNIAARNSESLALSKTEIGEYAKKNSIFGNAEYQIYEELSGHIKISSEKKALFVSVGKNGSSKVIQTMIEDLLHKDFKSRDEYICYRNLWYSKVETKINFALELDKIINDNSYFKFTIVRNPYQRLVSAWKNRVRDKSCLVHNIGYYRDFRTFSFPKFVNYIYKNKFNYSNLDQHWRPQHICIYSPVIEYDFIGHLENFNNDFKFILDKIGGSKNSYEKVNQRVNSTDKSDLRSFYTKELQDKVYDIYQKDFEMFNYGYEIPD
ncbi:sulfotransferase family protein [Maridesulfovibrio bastinii]|uniref:sulfotransferase family protein n=1 Tax=Maridesulfovibrio bastinii TaxID=47157 RepID=UPI0004036C3D|nr:sulfotransferase family protein [Maridesulfovibrio bastinii]